MNKQKDRLIKETENLLKKGNDLIEYGMLNHGHTQLEKIRVVYI